MSLQSRKSQQQAADELLPTEEEEQDELTEQLDKINDEQGETILLEGDSLKCIKIQSFALLIENLLSLLKKLFTTPMTIAQIISQILHISTEMS